MIPSGNIATLWLHLPSWNQVNVKGVKTLGIGFLVCTISSKNVIAYGGVGVKYKC